MHWLRARREGSQKPPIQTVNIKELMQSKSHLISVVIPHLNQPEELQCCLRSLCAQTIAHDLFEVIVADNGSHVLPQIDGQDFQIRLVQEIEPGPGAARNRGVAEASGDMLAFIDADCRAHRDWLKTALREMDSAPPRTVLGGDVQIWRDGPGAFSALEAYESIFAYRFQLYIEKHGFCGTGNLVVKRKDFYDIGPFKGIQFAEDVEWGRSVRAAGYQFRFVPDMVAYHPARKTLKELFLKWDRHIQHAANVARGQKQWRLRWIARAIAILMSPAADWVRILVSRRVQGPSARMKAIAVLIAVRVYRFSKMMGVLLSTKGVTWNQGNVIEGTGPS
jgi:glycosyltransferase involved in cell wall biosynthesis